jgi:acetyl-CoA C-acetyltransferase
MSEHIVIVAAKRTPIGGFLGHLSHLSAIDLAIASHQACLDAIPVVAAEIDEVWMGCVLSAGLGQAPARQTAIKAGLSKHSTATTVNKVCGSGLQTIICGHDRIQQQSAKIVLCGGMESMSNAPYLLEKARKGYRLGHGLCLDHMWLDGLQDAYDSEHRLMGCFAEMTAQKLKISRQAQDDYAKTSMQLALEAQSNHAFRAEIIPINDVFQDEQPQAAKLEKLARLKPVFHPDGSITPGNSSSIADGAASLILMQESAALARGLQPLARIKGFSQFAAEPSDFSTAPIYAIEKLLTQIQWSKSEIDLWEINEAFAAVALACIQTLELERDRVNVNGGACALGHPIGASGARIVVSLIHALNQRQLSKGIAAICIGGGEALAIALENLC